MTNENRSAAIQWVRTYGKTIAITVIVVFVIRWKVVEPFFIPSSSMEPTLKQMDRILVSKITYNLGRPARWNVVVFRRRAPDDPEKRNRNFVKRIVGLPGETLQIVGGEIYIDGKREKKPDSLRSISYSNMGKWGTKEAVSIPAGSYFVLGDNSDFSNDSRGWPHPFVLEKDIIGQAVTVIWPPGRIHFIR